MATTRATLKQYFKKYATPTEAQFHELIDAFVHKDEDSLTQSKIDGLVQALNEKVTTNEVNTLVENKVTEIVSDPQFAAAPTAHSHVAADVEGLSDFITRVTNFLDSADVSDTTINRWKEIETFLTGITDQETLAGLLLQLKNEITALIPAPAPTNYLKQISDLDAYTTAQEGEIVQYVGSTTAKYTRGHCYEKKREYSFDAGLILTITFLTDYRTIKAGTYYKTTQHPDIQILLDDYNGQGGGCSTGATLWVSADGIEIISTESGSGFLCGDYAPDNDIYGYAGWPVEDKNAVTAAILDGVTTPPTISTWQPIVTSPSVS